MKRIFNLFICFGILGCAACNNSTRDSNNSLDPIVRTGKSDIEVSNYFDDLENINNDVEYKTIAKKKISFEALSDFEMASMYADDFLITYEVVTNLEKSTITLNVYFDDTNEIIFEDFVGIPMTNYNDEEDILFSIDDLHIFLSELVQLDEQEQCSIFGNILHKTLNVGMAALAYIEPAIKILVYTSNNVLALLYTTVKNVSYIANYNYNSKKTQPSGFVYGQGTYSSWKFGFSNMKEAGCEVIAGYNLAHAKGKNFTLADTIFLYESLGIEIGIAQGFFGSNPYQISYFLNAVGISFTKVTNYKTFESYMKNSSNYYIILSRWNNEGADSPIHTFMIDKDNSYSKKFHAYNRFSGSTNTIDFTNYADYFGGSISNTYVCAYFVSK